MSSKQSTTPARGRKRESDARFTLVYAHQAKPKARHLDERCWRSASYRPATEEELKSLPICLHCVRRAERDDVKAAEAEKPTRQPIARNERQQPKAAAEKAQVTA